MGGFGLSWVIFFRELPESPIFADKIWVLE
jgi:hypothetical protein